MATVFTFICDHCGATFTRGRDRRTSGSMVFCSRDCQVKGQVYKTGRPYSKTGAYGKTHVCIECAISYAAHDPGVRYCSDTCRHRARNRRTAEKYRDQEVIGLPFEKTTKLAMKIALLEKEPKCRICQLDFDMVDIKLIHLDHCHGTGAVRGLLCFNCNSGLGHFKDDIERLERAVAYLREYERL